MQWLAAMVAGMVLSWLVWRFWAWQLMEDLREMAEAVDRISRGDFEVRVRAKSWDDVSGLGERINRMAASLKERLGEIHEDKNRLEAILLHMVNGIILLNPRKRVVLFNPAAEEIFALPGREALGKYYLEVLRDYELEAKLEMVLREGATVLHELKLVFPEDKILESHLAPVRNEAGDVAGILMVIRDVTRARHLERMRTEFVANVSHELQTPLTAIKGYAETLLDGAMEDSATCRRFLGIIDEEAGRLTRLIDDLLDLSQIESGQMKPRRREVALGDLVRQVLARLEPGFRKKGVMVETDLPAGLPTVHVDPDQVGQVLLNLLDNGIKYTPPGGRITIGARDLGGEVEVSVTDTGIGIPEKDLPRIFERFYRVDKARSRASGGTGLGLAIVKHIVEAHGGRVGVKSTPGEGSRFYFTLPKLN